MRKSKFETEEERSAYRKKYKAEWFQKKYDEDPEWKDKHREKNRRRVKELSKEEKKLRSDKQLKYHNKRMGEMTEEEKRSFVDRRKVYLRERRDKGLIPEYRKKYDLMDNKQKISFLEKLGRYKKLADEFETEMKKARAQGFGADC
jgi:hypothetical protein